MLSFVAWTLYVLLGIAYVVFVVRRQEAGLRSTVLLAIAVGPIAWLFWFAQRSGRRRAHDATGLSSGVTQG